VCWVTPVTLALCLHSGRIFPRKDILSPIRESFFPLSPSVETFGYLPALDLGSIEYPLGVLEIDG